VPARRRIEMTVEKLSKIYDEARKNELAALEEFNLAGDDEKGEARNKYNFWLGYRNEIGDILKEEKSEE
jgi:hypothetical protein